jgi:hypothetical protein
MRLFRQSELGQWDPVINRVGLEVARWADPRVNQGAAEASRPVMALSPPAHVEAPRREASRMTRVVETRHGILQYWPDSDPVATSITAFGEYLEGELDLLRRLVKTGAWVIEAGAGLGAHTIPLARHVGGDGHIIAYEPRPLFARVLRQNLESNRCRPGHRDAGDARRTRRAERGGRSTRVAEDTVDGLRVERLDLLKINPGADAAKIIGGAGDTLWRLRPIVFVNAADEAELRQIARQLNEYGYRCWRFATPYFRPENFNRSPAAADADRISLALAACPEEWNIDLEFDNATELDARS